MPLVHSAYRRYRQPLLDAGVEIFEVRPVPNSFAPTYVFDRQRVFVGSANLDPRSLELNTELGLLIESPDLAQQVIERFDEFLASSNSYRVVRNSDEPLGAALRWRTSVDGRIVVWSFEPDTTLWQRTKVDFLAFLPIEDQL